MALLRPARCRAGTSSASRRASSASRSRASTSTRKIHKKAWQHPKLVFYEDGSATTVTVDQWGKTFSLKNNGKVDASNDSDMATQIVVGLLPLLLYQGPGRRPRSRSSATARASRRAPSRSTRSSRSRSSSSSRRSTARRTSSTTTTTGRSRTPRSRRAWATGATSSTQRSRSVRRHREPAVEPVAHGRVEPVHARVLPRHQDAPRAARSVLPVGAALRDVALEHQDDLPHAARGVPLRLRLRGRGSVVGHDPHRERGAASSWTSRRSSAPSAIRRRAPRRAAPASRRRTTSFAYLLLGPDELAVVHGRLARQHRRQRAHRVQRRRATCSATPSSIPTWPRSTGRMWPYGRLTELVSGYDGPDRAAPSAGSLARSLLAHGKAREAELWTRRAEAAGDAPEARHARLLLRPRLDAHRPRSGDPARARRGARAAGRAGEAGGGAPGATSTRVADEYRRSCSPTCGAHRYATAYEILDKWPEPLWTGLGQDFALLIGLPRLQGRVLQRRRRHAEAALRRRHVRGAPARGALLPRPRALREREPTARPSTPSSASCARSASSTARAAGLGSGEPAEADGRAPAPAPDAAVIT